MCKMHLNVLHWNIGLNTLMAFAKWRCSFVVSSNTVQSCQRLVLSRLGWSRGWLDPWNLTSYLNPALQFNQSVYVFRETLDMHHAWLCLHRQYWQYLKVFMEKELFQWNCELNLYPAHDLLSTGSPDVICYLDEVWMNHGWATGAMTWFTVWIKYL